ncbi:paraquat-inducible protein A [Echinimonas agarilytica]|uniref:Paraquat-inducible protein A n=1 Tax=Echinimonas agarilytica TaxID=1215918 RepID=A0AA41W5C5_9GAMM|nr:paraquat-inducible protein A [Echinimonas agarilytica]MCM2679026.1 paraquat-inducible protein A [Echinimonas agarilytica]
MSKETTNEARDLKSNSHYSTACGECDVLIFAQTIEAGEHIRCPRCDHHISALGDEPVQGPIATSIAALFMMFASLSFPYLSFSASGNTASMTFSETIRTLLSFGYDQLALLLFITLVVLPIGFLVIVLYLHTCLLLGVKGVAVGMMLKIVRESKPWLMVDVFLIGVLVALVKVMGMADVEFGLSFWAFCLFTGLFIKTMILFDSHWLWHQFYGECRIYHLPNAQTADEADLVLCHKCGQLNPKENARCDRCLGDISVRFKDSLQRVWALLFASVVLYIPANVLPIMDTSLLGVRDPSTILGGVVLLWQLESYPVAIVIFVASVCVPIAKMLAMAWLAYSVHYVDDYNPHKQIKLYRITEFIGRWSMIDVFVVAILAALIHIDGLVAVYPGPAAVSFAAVVIMTMVAASSFDPRLIWDKTSNRKDVVA